MTGILVGPVVTEPGAAGDPVAPAPPPPAAEPSLSRSTGVMMAGTAASRITGFGRNIALALAVGQGRLTDAYNVANTTPNIVYELLLGGVLSATLIPIFVEQLSLADVGGADGERSWRDLSAVVTLTLVVSLVAAAIFALCAPLLARLYLSSDATRGQVDLAVTLIRLFAFQIVAYAATTLATALLNTRRRFASPMLAPVANNLIVIATFLIVPRVAGSLDVDAFSRDRSAVLVLGLGTTLGVVAMGGILVSRLGATGLLGRGHITFRWAPRSPGVRRVVGLSGWTLLVVIANQVALWVVFRLATGMPGAQSAYVAAMVFFLLPHGVYAVSVRSAIEPQMAEQFVHGRLDQLGERLNLGFRLTTAALVPAGIGLALIARPMITVLLEHGRFDHDDVVRTAGALTCLALGLPGFSAFQLLTVGLQAMKDVKTMFFLYVFENAVNIVVALLLFSHLDVRGLAISYGVAYTAAAVAAVVLFDRRLPAGWRDGTGRFLLGCAAAGALLAVAVADAQKVVRYLDLPTTLGALAELAAGIAAGGLAYLIAARLVGLTEVHAMLSPVRRLTRRLDRRR